MFYGQVQMKLLQSICCTLVGQAMTVLSAFWAYMLDNQAMYTCLVCLHQIISTNHHQQSQCLVQGAEKSPYVKPYYESLWPARTPPNLAVSCQWPPLPAATPLLKRTWYKARQKSFLLGLLRRLVTAAAMAAATTPRSTASAAGAAAGNSCTY